MKPGGKLVILEFSKPTGGFFLPIYKLYLRVIAPKIGKIISGNLEAYKYLNDSVNAFPEGEDFISILVKTGFEKTYFKKLSMGICTIYCGTKVKYSYRNTSDQRNVIRSIRGNYSLRLTVILSP